MFFDFHIRENKELIKEAERLGYNGIAVFESRENNSPNNNSPNDKITNNDEQRYGFEKLNQNSSNQDSSFRIKRGVEINAKNPEDLKRKVQKFRKKADVLLVHGGDLKINRAACENPLVDIISHPYNGRRDSGINHILAKRAEENRVAVELNIRYLLKVRPKYRYKVLGQFREILKLKRKFNFPLIITSGTHSIYDLHTPQDIMALSYCFGMNGKEAFEALSKTPQNIMVRNEVRNDALVEGASIIR